MRKRKWNEMEAREPKNLKILANSGFWSQAIPKKWKKSARREQLEPHFKFWSEKGEFQFSSQGQQLFSILFQNF